MNKQPFFSTVRFLGLLICFWLLVSGCAGLRTTVNDSGPVSLTLLFFNDTHGYLMPFEIETEDGVRQEVGGIARMAALIDKIRRENETKDAHTLVLIAGDILQGTPMSTVFKGIPDVHCFNAMGVDAMTVGNHEFDFGLENFLVLKKQAEFPFISANIVYKDTGELLCEPAATFILGNQVLLTVIGVTTRDLLSTTKAENIMELDVREPLLLVKNEYEKVRNLGPVILLSHSRHETDRAIAREFPGLVAVIGGHDQILLTPYRKVGNVPIFQASEKGRYLGRVDLEIDPVSQKTEIVSSTYIPVTSEIRPDPETDIIIRRYHDQMDKKFREVIGTAETFLDGERERIRYQETSLGNFIADIMLENTTAHLALINSGAIRSSMHQGAVTVEDVFKAMPYENEIVLVQITGADLERVLMHSVKGSREKENGGFLQVAGLSFSITGKKVKNIRVGKDHRPLDPEGIYIAAIPDFLSTGGDGYHMFVGKPQINTRLPLKQLIVETIRDRQRISGKIEGRIIRESDNPH